VIAQPPDNPAPREPVWRYVKFFIYVPWAIAVPEGYSLIQERSSDPGCGEQSVVWLSDFMPAQIAAEMAQQPQSTFVALEFHRLQIELVRWIQHYFDIEPMAETWTIRYALGGHLPAGYAPAPHEADPLSTYGTVIEATTCLIDGTETNQGHALNEAFDRCIRECEGFLEAYVQTSRDFRSGFINRSTVLPMVPAILIDPAARRTESTGLRVNDEGAYPGEPPVDLTQEQADEIGYRLRLSEEGEPYIAVWHWRRLAFRSLHVDGDYAATIVFTHTAGEVFFDSLLMRLAWEEIRTFRGASLTQAEVAQWFSARNPLSRRLRAEYHRRLNGAWDADRPGNPIYEWDRKVARLRNRIVHTGYRPTVREAEDAFQTLLAVETYVFDLLVRDRNRTRYPLTVYMMVGEAGLEQRGLYIGKLRRAILDAPADWRSSFYEFRRWVSDNATP
jgi:hypothetical protein